MTEPTIYKSKITEIVYVLLERHDEWVKMAPVSDDPEDAGFIWVHVDDMAAQFVVV